MAETLDHIDAFIAEGRPRYIATANVHFAVIARDDLELRRILCEADLVLCDGTPLLWAARWLGAPLRERVAGSDLLPPLLARAAQRGHRVFFLGATNEVLTAAKEKSVAEHPGLNVCGTLAPPFGDLHSFDHAGLRAAVAVARPDLMLVAMGCPKQEKLIAMTLHTLGVPCAIGVGASLDFLAGKFLRAPNWMKRTGTEWMFRLSQEPRRLASRYAEDFGFFFPSLAKELGRRRRAKLRTKRQTDAPAIPGASWSRWRGEVTAAELHAGRVELPTPRAKGEHRILDLEHVSAIDAMGLGVLVTARKIFREAGAHLLLYRPSKAVSRALSISRLDTIVRVVDSLEEAASVLQHAPMTAAVDASYDDIHGILRLRVAGELTARTVAEALDRILAACAARPAASAVHLELAEVELLDTAGVGALRDLARRTTERGAQFLLENLHDGVRNVIRCGGGAALLEPARVPPTASPRTAQGGD